MESILILHTDIEFYRMLATLSFDAVEIKKTNAKNQERNPREILSNDYYQQHKAG
jgi:hypothetical protein